MARGDPSQRRRDILLLAQCIAELPRVQKKVLVMRYYENLQPAEIAAYFGLTEHEIELILCQTVRLVQTKLLRELA
jgi:DNA-directed RNA polymerase specialized sigma24 family protein